MADFLRPAARAALWRWRGLIVAGAVAGLGLWWALIAFGFVRWLGWALVALGAALAVTAAQRLRFGAPGGGVGVVQVVERRLAYFGPVTGGVIDLDDLVRLQVARGQGGAAWLLTGPGGQHLAVPANAVGAEVLFDAFAALPGLSAEALIAAVNAPPAAPQTLWLRAKDQLRG